MEREERTRYTGHHQQLYGVRRVRLQEGRGKGTDLIEVTTAGGLQLDVLPDAGLDIGLVRYRGYNMSYVSKNGYDSPAAFSPHENEFVHTFPGGMLYTCGLRSAGPACRDGGEWFPLHGRYHGLQAEEICASVEGDSILVSGVIRETALFGHVLRLKRRITVPVFGSVVTVEDSLDNLTARPEEFMLLYHVNFGYPMLSESARLTLPGERKTTPRTEHAKTGLGRECAFEKPTDGAEEQVYFHEMGTGCARLDNPAIGAEAALSWSLDTLPVLAEWKSMASGDYALGLEPGNSYIMGRHAERENGTLRTIGGFETVKTMVRLQFGMSSTKPN